MLLTKDKTFRKIQGFLETFKVFFGCDVFAFSPYFGKIDVVFINGNHSYEAVKSDTADVLKMVKPNGASR
jgi:hypothetical protein